MRLNSQSVLVQHAGKICGILGVTAAASALWLSRSYSISSESYAADDRYYWAALLSFCALMVLVGIGIVRSEKFRIAFGRSFTLCVLFLLMYQWAGLRIAAFPLMPGSIALMMAFGVHGSPNKWVALVWYLGINTTVYACVIAALSRHFGEQGANS